MDLNVNLKGCKTELFVVVGLIVGFMFTLSHEVSLTTISVFGGPVQTKGSTVQIVCTVANFQTGVISIFKTDSSAAPAAGTQINICIKTECDDSTIGRYEFSTDIYHVNITIRRLNRTDDQKWWHCVGSSDTVFKSTYLKVVSPPDFLTLTSVPEGVTDISDTSITLSCQTPCVYPPENISLIWFFVKGNDRKETFAPVIASRNVTKEGCIEMESRVSSTIILQRYTVFSNNTPERIKFECAVIHFEGLLIPVFSPYSSELAFSVIAESPVLKNKPSNGLINGYPVQLMCISTPTRPAVSVTWRLGTTVLPNVSNTVEETGGLKVVDSTVTFIPTRDDHQKDVSCETKIPGQTVSASAQNQIKVWYPPDVTVNASTSNFNVNQSLSIRCEASGRPAVYTYMGLIQTVNGNTIPNPHQPLSGTVKHSSLYIDTLKLDDSGTFMCLVQNGVKDKTGNLKQTSVLDVFVQGPPEVTSEENSFNCIIGTNCTLNISIYSDPPYKAVSVTRILGDQNFDVDRLLLTTHISNSTAMFYGRKVQIAGILLVLSVNNITQDHFSDYTLDVMNEIGVTSWRFYIVQSSTSSVKETDSGSVAVIISVVITAAVVIVIVTLVLLYLYVKRRRSDNSENKGQHVSVKSGSKAGQEFRLEEHGVVAGTERRDINNVAGFVTGTILAFKTLRPQDKTSKGIYDDLNKTRIEHSEYDELHLNTGNETLTQTTYENLEA